MAGRLLIAQATGLLVRGFASVPADRFTPSGEPASGLHAVARVIRAGLALKEPELAVAVVDSAGVGEGAEPQLVAQAPELRALLEGLGFHCIEHDQPADLVAAYAVAAQAVGLDVVVLGSDKRFAQLVGPGAWWYDGYKRVRYTAMSVRKRFLVDPEHVADWLGLVGDDGVLAGVKGIGGKGAAGLIEAVGSIREALERPDELPGRAGKLLREQLEVAREQLDLAHLDAALPLPVAVDDLPEYEQPSIAEMNRQYAGLGFHDLLVAESAPPRAEISEDLPEDFGLLSAAIHVLTGPPSAARGDFAGIALVSGRQRRFFRSLGPNLVRWLEDPGATKYGHHTKEAAVALARLGVTLRGVFGDSVVASHLVDPSGSAPHELHQLARARLHRPVLEAEDVLGTGAKARTWMTVHDTDAGAFACERAQAAVDLWFTLESQLERSQVDEYLALSETLARMELHGVPCDREELDRVGDDFVVMAGELEREVFELAGHAFNLRSTKQLGEVLYEELGLTVHGRTRTGWSTATHVLERLRHDHPIVPLVIRYRLLERLRSSWVVALGDAISDDGRVHTSFHPARSFSGRLVNSAPDLGRVPGRTPVMERIRKAFRARPGWRLLSVDYDQLGLYVLAHLTGDPALVEPLTRGDDMHRLTAAAVLDRPPESIDHDARQIGKVVNFATFAGQGASALRRQLGVSVEEARDMIARFDVRYAVTRAFQDEQLRLAQERGYIRTITGRRWPIRDVHSKDLQMRGYGERLARRGTHEGSVADVTRRSLLRSDQALRAAGSSALPLLQIHDEVLFEVPNSELHEAAHIASQAFRTAFDMRVPLRVSAKAGENWSELEPLAEYKK